MKSLNDGWEEKVWRGKYKSDSVFINKIKIKKIRKAML